MQFSAALLAALAVGTQVLAAPHVIVSEGDVATYSETENIYDAMCTLEHDVAADAKDIFALLSSITSDVTIGSEVNTKLSCIVESLTTATAAVVQNTPSVVPSLVTSEVALVIIILETIDKVVEELVKIISCIVVNLVDDAGTLVEVEVVAILRLLNPILNSLGPFVASIIDLGEDKTLPIIGELQSALSCVKDDIANAVSKYQEILI